MRCSRSRSRSRVGKWVRCSRSGDEASGDEAHKYKKRVLTASCCEHSFMTSLLQQHHNINESEKVYIQLILQRKTQS